MEKTDNKQEDYILKSFDYKLGENILNGIENKSEEEEFENIYDKIVEKYDDEPNNNDNTIIENFNNELEDMNNEIVEENDNEMKKNDNKIIEDIDDKQNKKDNEKEKTNDNELEKNDNKIEKTFQKINILVAGKTGVGKSSLINAILKEELAQTGVGSPVTDYIKDYSIENEQLSLFDTKGISLKNFDEVIKNIESFINEKKNSTCNDNQQIHIAWVCISEGSSRIEEIEINLVDMLSKFIPVIIVITKSLFNQDFLEEVQKICINAKKFVCVNSVELVLEDGYIIKPKNLRKLINCTYEILGVPFNYDNEVNENNNISQNHSKENISKSKESIADHNNFNKILNIESIDLENLTKKINYYSIILATALSLEKYESNKKIKQFSNDLKHNIIIEFLEAITNEHIKPDNDFIDKANKIFISGNIQINENEKKSNEEYGKMKNFIKNIVQAINYKNKDESTLDTLFKKSKSSSSIQLKNEDEASFIEKLYIEVSNFFIISYNILLLINRTLKNNENNKDLLKNDTLINIIYNEFSNFEEKENMILTFDDHQKEKDISLDEFNLRLKHGFFITDYFTVVTIMILVFIKKESKSNEIINNIKNTMFQNLKELFKLNDENILKTINSIQINNKNDKDNINKNINYILNDIPVLKEYFKKKLSKDKLNTLEILNNTGIQICVSRSEMFANKNNL